MKFGDQCWAFALRLLDFMTLSSLNHRQTQQPIGSVSDIHQPNRGGPVFSPPNGPDDYFCDYSHMKGKGWHECSTPSNRGCWLSNGTHEYNIHTNYESDTPTGITRKYTLDVSNKTLAPDGWFNPDGKVFNQSYPGPWIKACWGDIIEVTVKNHLRYNGTTIHWHGIRQLGTMEADGVNGVTQCPIAGYPTNDSYTYKFKALQYGSSWYHSHYALQYSDGLVAPMTIFGPSSANYDDAIDPLLMTDWVHQSAFSLFWQEITPGPGPPRMQSSLLNGVGRFTCADADKQAGKCIDQSTYYNTTVKAGKKYLLRLINTSTATTYIFSIDNHKIKVIGADFVPIVPYETESVLVGIGQRYHVIVEANPTGDKRPKERQAYWIRTVVADGCSGFARSSTPDSRTGIWYYEGADKSSLPNTSQGTFAVACSDEPYEKLVPVVPWTVGRPSNEQEPSTFQVGVDDAPYDGPHPPPPGNFTHWVLGKQPLWLNFSHPTILEVNKQRKFWPSQYVIVPEPVNENNWVYLLITASAFPFGNTTGRNFLPVNHPIHLHGHDFAILAQSSTPYWDGGIRDVKLDNPPRRDVALLHLGGYLVLAFKADNPGSWLMHCHIAWHASSGLALQVLERDMTTTSVPISNSSEIERVCSNWKSWLADKSNWWDPQATEFQEDSGI